MLEWRVANTTKPKANIMNYTFNEYGQLDEHPDYYAEPEPDFMELADYDEAEAERLAKEWFKGKRYAA